MLNRLFVGCLSISVILHIGSMVLLSVTQENPKTQEVIEIAIIQAPEPKASESVPLRKKMQIVEQSKKQINDEIPEDAKYLSRHNQTVVRETKASGNGDFNNNGGLGHLKTSPQKKKTVKRNPPRKVLPSLADLKLDPIWKQPTFPPKEEVAPLPSEKGSQRSQTNDYLENVETGLQTLLSTREFIYYSYYSRIKSQLRQHWEPKIREKMRKILRKGRRVASTGNRVTKVIITLDHKGTLIRVQILGKSGIEDLDEAAVEAFRAAAPFPNPPKGIVEKDGTIKIRWNFVLEA